MPDTIRQSVRVCHPTHVTEVSFEANICPPDQLGVLHNKLISALAGALRIDEKSAENIVLVNANTGQEFGHFIELPVEGIINMFCYTGDLVVRLTAPGEWHRVILIAANDARTLPEALAEQMFDFESMALHGVVDNGILPSPDELLSMPVSELDALMRSVSLNLTCGRIVASCSAWS